MFAAATAAAAAASVALVVTVAPLLASAPSQDEMNKMLRVIDERQGSNGDYKWLGYIEQKEKGKPDTAFEAVVYRRELEEKLMILFTKPKTEAGKGYLRIDNNLFMYDPTVGKWERRTERERIAG